MSLLKNLCETYGPTGVEDKVIELIKGEFNETKVEIIEDRVGNLVVKKSGTTPHITITSHTDEAGLFIHQIREDGSLGFKPVGILPNSLVGKKVLVGEKAVPGVIGFIPIHLQGVYEIYQSPIKAQSLSIDIGCSKKDDAAGIVQVGDWAVFPASFIEDKGVFTGKALDNRLSVGALIELLKDTSIPNGITGVFTRVRKTWIWGSSAAGYAFASDYNFVLESVAADDGPRSSRYDGDLAHESDLGAGPVISVLDHGHVSSKLLFDYAVKAAEQQNIPFQYKQSSNSLTESQYFSLSGEGHKVLVLSIPIRYQNSPVSLSYRADWEGLQTLLKATITNLPNTVD
jgi:putative aminopeptidase FrvX